MQTINKKLQLFSNQRCPYAQRVRILLNLEKIDCDIVEINLQNKPKSFLKISPFKTVPILKDGDAVILESHLINQYLVDKFKDKSLKEIDHGPIINYYVSFYTDYFNKNFCNPYYQLLDSKNQTDRERIIKDIDITLHYLEMQLFEKIDSDWPFILGEKVTLLDINFFPHFERFLVAGLYRGARIIKKYTNIIKWFEKLVAIDGFFQTLKPFEIQKEIFKKYAVNSFSDSDFINIFGWN